MIHARSFCARASALAAMALAAATANASGTFLYGLSSNFFQPNFGALYSIDPASGAATFLTNVTDSGGNSIGTSIVGLSYMGGQLYAVDVFGSGGNFGTINTSTGVFNPIGNPNNSINLWTLAPNPGANVLYSIDADGGGNPNFRQLISIDPATGNATELGVPTDVTGAQQLVNDIAFDTANNTLYGWVGNGLYSINTSNAALTLIGTSSINPGNNGDMTYDPMSDSLFFNDGQNLWSVDKTNGNATMLGANGVGSVTIDGLAAVPEPAPMFALGVGIVSLLARRRNRR